MICETLGSILRTEIEKHKTNKNKENLGSWTQSWITVLQEPWASLTSDV